MKQQILQCCRALCLLVGLVSLASCKSTAPIKNAHQGEVDHIVFMWLKEPGNEKHTAELIAASKKLTAIPGVKSVDVGTMIPSKRAVVDSTYDIGMSVRYKDVSVGPIYQDHPLHQQAVERIKALTKKILVYDYRLE